MIMIWWWLIPLIGSAIVCAYIITKESIKESVKDTIKGAWHIAVKDKTSHSVTIDVLASDGEYNMTLRSEDGVSDDIEEGNIIYV